MDNRVSDELVERMVALTRKLAEHQTRDPRPVGLLFDEASAIAELLPKPVDPDLLEARRMAASRGDGMDARIIAGEFDRYEMVEYRLAGIKRGRELASPNLGAGSLGGER